MSTRAITETAAKGNSAFMLRPAIWKRKLESEAVGRARQGMGKGARNNMLHQSV